MSEGSTVLVLEEEESAKNVVQKFMVMSLDMDLLRMLIILQLLQKVEKELYEQWTKQ